MDACVIESTWRAANVFSSLANTVKGVPGNEHPRKPTADRKSRTKKWKQGPRTIARHGPRNRRNVSRRVLKQKITEK